MTSITSTPPRNTTLIHFLKFSLIFAVTINSALANFTSRLKDIVELSEVRENTFTGYGIVVGLPGTGDRRNSGTKKSLKNFLSKQGIEIDSANSQLRNAAMVMVSAATKGFLGPGDKVTIQVASMGDARSIENGLLLPTSLRAGNNQIYLTGNGVITTSPANPTRGNIINGGIVEKDFTSNNNSLLYNRNIIFLKIISYFPDYSGTIKNALATEYPDYSIQIISERKMSIAKPNEEKFTAEEILGLLSYEIEFSPPAKIVIDINTGAVIMGDDVRINPVHISLPSVTLTLGNLQEAGRSGGNFTEAKSLMEELNKLSATPEEITAIFSALKKSGAMNAELIMQ